MLTALHSPNSFWLNRLLSVAPTLVGINIKSKSVQMFDALHNLCVYKHSLFSTAPTMLLHLAPAKKWSINSCCSKQNKNLLNSSISQTASLALLYTLSLQARNSLLHFDLLNDCSILGTIPHYTKNKKNGVQCCVCMTNQPWPPKLMLDSMLYIPKEKNKTQTF